MAEPAIKPDDDDKPNPNSGWIMQIVDSLSPGQRALVKENDCWIEFELARRQELRRSMTPQQWKAARRALEAEKQAEGIEKFLAELEAKAKAPKAGKFPRRA